MTVHELTVVVETVAVSGSITVDGAAPPVSAYDSAAIFLVDTESLDRIKIGETVNGALDSFTLIKGRSYGLYYAGPKDGLIMPRDEWTMLQVVAEDPTVIDVAIEGAQVEATLTLDDAPPPSSPLNKGTLALQYAGARAPLGAVVDGVATGRVIRSEAVKGVEGWRWCIAMSRPTAGCRRTRGRRCRRRAAARTRSSRWRQTCARRC
ncbi:MAG: hypothetical protein IPK80_00725 [Nannocystis sp.]|nr:hypothetical protein [Nannocystis sp.]